MRIRSDHRKEFENTIYANFCDEYGTIHEFLAPKTPQQNGVVERKNRALQEMAHMMSNRNKLSERFWAEAINMACYTINRIYLRPSTRMIPYEIWKGKKPNVGYFHVFGNMCYILNDCEHLGKFDSKSDQGVFFDYSNSSKVYHVYNMRT